MGNVLKTAKTLLAGTILLAVFSLLPGGSPLTSHAAAAMDHSTTPQSQNCCTNTQTTVIRPSNQHPEEEKDEDPAPPQEPYYVQFLTFAAPKKLEAAAYTASSARPPDLVKLYANYRF